MIKLFSFSKKVAFRMSSTPHPVVTFDVRVQLVGCKFQHLATTESTKFSSFLKVSKFCMKLFKRNKFYNRIKNMNGEVHENLQFSSIILPEHLISCKRCPWYTWSVAYVTEHEKLLIR